MSGARRLPGIRFVAAPPAAAEVLPRMDIAAFVGFAGAGPLHRPVVMEDETRYREIFGPDLQLAWDEENGAWEYAQLGRAVKSFFASGGKRCWVVRVAAEENTVTPRYPLPGVVSINTNGEFKPAVVSARAAGSWAASLSLRALMQQSYMDVLESGNDHVTVSLAENKNVTVGDLLRLHYEGRVTEFRTVTALKVENDRLSLKTQNHVWLVDDLSSPYDLSSLTLVSIDGEPVAITPALLEDPTHQLVMDVSLDATLARPQKGMVTQALTHDGQTLLVAIDDVTEIHVDGDVSVQRFRLISDHLWRRMDVSPSSVLVPTLVELLHLNMVVSRQREEKWSLTGLGFNRNHPLAWQKLPTDNELFPSVDGAGYPVTARRSSRSLTQDERVNPLHFIADHPRFPLAGNGEVSLSLPLMLGRWPSTATGMLVGQVIPTPIEADGLADYSEDLFVDDELKAVSEHMLADEAYFQRYEKSRALQGMHSLYFLDEVTLLSVPDAIHRGWDQGISSSVPILTPPSLQQPTLTDSLENLSFQWQGGGAYERYELEMSPTPDFLTKVGVYEAEGDSLFLAVPAVCAGRYWFRLRGVLQGAASPWSVTRSLWLPSDLFVPCDEALFPEVSLEPVKQIGSFHYLIKWVSAVSDDIYELQEAGRADFADGVTLYCGDETSYTLVRTVEAVAYFRVRLIRENGPGPWSETRWLVPQPTRRWQLKPVSEHSNEVTMHIHRAMVRMAVSRADLFCILSVSRHFRPQEVLAYKQNLRTLFPASVSAALSYFALYYPWLSVSGEVQSPDGCACGLVAYRSWDRGAWVAPANDTVSQIIALEKRLSGVERQVLYENQINVFHQDGEGGRLMSADTLSEDESLIPLNVRRLLMLLRRLALREGNEMVFEVNDAALRRRVTRRFETLLGMLFSRGAFAGDEPESAFQVVADETINPISSIEQGRLVVELKVAPSRPLEFLLVRLVQSSGDGVSVGGS